MAGNIKTIDAAIPGQAWTAAPGSRPWRKPYKYTTIEETVEFYLPRLLDPKSLNMLKMEIKKGIPITFIVETLIQSSVMEGIHSLDVGLLISPVLMEILMAVLDKENIKYNTGLEEDTMDLEKAAMREAFNEGMELPEETMPEEQPMEEQQQQPIQPQGQGLMARTGGAE